MEQQPPNAGAGARGGIPARASRPAPPPYPKPPAFPRRVVLLCLKPESWAAAARYPFHVTLLPLIFVILLGALVATAGQTYRAIHGLMQFASTYDTYYPPMELNAEGVLSAKGELKGPVRVPLFGSEFLVDPTGKTNPETVNFGLTMALITDQRVCYMSPISHEVESQPLGELAKMAMFTLPPAGQVKLVNGRSIGAYVSDQIPMLLMGAVLAAIFQALLESAWAAAVIFLMAPAIVLAAGAGMGSGRKGALLLPRRVAYRMTAALVVPLVAIGAVLRAAGDPIVELLGPNALLFWFLAALGLAVWTGILARRMYGAKR